MIHLFSLSRKAFGTKKNDHVYAKRWGFPFSAVLRPVEWAEPIPSGSAEKGKRSSAAISLPLAKRAVRQGWPSTNPERLKAKVCRIKKAKKLNINASSGKEV